MSQSKKNQRPDQSKDKQKKQLSKKQQKKIAEIQRKKRKQKEWLISLIITLVILCVIILLQWWYVRYTHLGMRFSIVWKLHAIGGIVMLFIVHHFVKKPDDGDQR